MITLANGTYYGVELGLENHFYYYKSEFLVKKPSIGFDFSFVLNYYSFCRVACYKEGFNFIKRPNKDKIPLILESPIRFSGIFKDNLLIIRRITSLELFSSSEEMIFLKVNGFPLD